MNLLNLLGLRKNLISPIPDEELMSARAQARGFLSPLGSSVAPSPTQSPTPMPTPTSFGSGSEVAYIEPALYDALMAKVAEEKLRILLAELSGQESSYGYAGPHISNKEESYGPYHINLNAGRINPMTSEPLTRSEVTNPNIATQYALSELKRTGGLGAWNPGAYDFYQYELPKRAETKRFVRGE